MAAVTREREPRKSPDVLDYLGAALPVYYWVVGGGLALWWAWDGSELVWLLVLYVVLPISGFWPWLLATAHTRKGRHERVSRKGTT